MYPVFLDLTEQLVLVVGAGPVGWRRLTNLHEAGARIRLVCLEQPQQLLPSSVELILAPYQANHLEGVRLALAAATDTVNRQVVEDARQRGIWVNTASDQTASEFHVPAVVRRGPLHLALSTSGAAPSLTPVLRQRLEETFDEKVGMWIELLGELRPLVLQLPAQRQKEVFQKLNRWEWLEWLRQEDVDSVRQGMLELVRSEQT